MTASICGECGGSDGHGRMTYCIDIKGHRGPHMFAPSPKSRRNVGPKARYVAVGDDVVSEQSEDEQEMLDMLCDGDPVALVSVPRAVIRRLRDRLAYASDRASIDSQYDDQLREKTWNDAMERAAQMADAYADLYKSQAATRIAEDCRACRLPLPSPSALGLPERDDA